MRLLCRRQPIHDDSPGAVPQRRFDVRARRPRLKQVIDLLAAIRDNQAAPLSGHHPKSNRHIDREFMQQNVAPRRRLSRRPLVELPERFTGNRS